MAKPIRGLGTDLSRGEIKGGKGVVEMCDKVNISTTKHENLQLNINHRVIIAHLAHSLTPPVPLFLVRAALHTEVVPSLKTQ